MVLLRNLYCGNLTLKDADLEQCMFVTELKKVKRRKIADRKKFFQ